MADVLSREQRHRNMQNIRNKDTKPEILVRKYLFSRGLRFRKNDKRYPGHPDIVLPKYKTVVFINGCFWHGHEGCKFFVMPKINVDFWREKISSNIKRDNDARATLESMGWQVIVVWECELRTAGLRSERLQRLFEEIIAYNHIYK